jgi:sugar/nucleoside kinase (ribokinase family)
MLFFDAVGRVMWFRLLPFLLFPLHNQKTGEAARKENTVIEVCVVGEINLDLILYGLPQELVTDRELLASGMALTLGSSSGIFAHNLSVLGTKVGFISKIGSDPLGKIAVERLSVAGVDTSRMKHGTGETSTGLTVVLPVAESRYMLTYPGTMFEMRYSDIDMDYVCGARHLHLSSYFLHRALRPRIVDLFRHAKEAGLTTSLDTNDDPENQWGRDLHEVLKYVDLVFPNEREAKKIAGTDDVAQAVDFLAGLAKIVVVKRGSGPAICRSGNEQWHLAPPVVNVADDVGAGDTFNSGFIYLYLRGAKLEDCLAFANIAAAYSVTKAGGTEAFRNRTEWLAFLERQWASTGRGVLPVPK